MGSQNQVSRDQVSTFKKYFMEVKDRISDEQVKEFEKLRCDQERIKFASAALGPVHACGSELMMPMSGKDEKMAKELKEAGNRAFAKGEFDRALACYNESIVNMPGRGSFDLALTVANRSAVFYHLQEYQLAVNDVDVALALNYPKDLRYKVLERKSKSLLALKYYELALDEFKKTIQSLDESKLSSERKLKIQTDIQIMMNLMTKPYTKDCKNVLPLSLAEKKHLVQDSDPELIGSKNKIYEAASEKVVIEEDPSAGRYAAACADLAAGETLLVEKPYCSVLLAEFSKTNCQNCFKRTLAPYPCTNCSYVVFCCLECKESAESTYHKYECKVLNTLHQSGVSVTVLMALRIISQKNVNYFLELKNNLTEPKETRNVDKYTGSDYSNVFHLVRHESLRKTEDFFERTVMALFLLRCLSEANYFPKHVEESLGTISENQKYIGGLLLRHLQILQFNAHEISELEMKRGRNLEEAKSSFIGGGLYPTLALFNHSCDPGIVRYFVGTKVVVRTVKPIKRGEMIAENYGPIYSQMEKKERQEKLKTQYWFQCSCVPCQESWPTFDEMNKSLIRFRCDARKSNGEKYNYCSNVLEVPVSTQEFMFKCLKCGQLTNLFRGLKLLQGTDAMHKKASSDVRRENYKLALATYLEILTMLHDILAPPFRDYLLCQQSIRKCMLTLGNKHVKP